MTTRISENDLILPALFVMSTKPNYFISTTDLRNELRNILQPQGRDEEIINGRNDTYFDQKVRNLISHKTLESKGYVERVENLRGVKITEFGLKFLHENIDAINYIILSNFQWEDAKNTLKIISQNDKPIKVFDEDVTIFEGAKISKSIEIYQRSKKLRDRAVEHYTDINRGEVFCEICHFDFEKKYGELGKGYIEMHHEKPIFMFEDDDIEKTISAAILNLKPVCANCHRIIHRKRPPYSLQTIKSSLRS